MVGRSAFGGRDGPEGGRLSAGTPWNGRRVFGGRRRRVPVRPGRNESAPRNADSAGTRLYAVGTGDLPEGEKGGQLGRFRGFFGPRRLKIEQEEIADSYNSGKKDIFVTQRKFYGKTVSILFTGNGPFGDRSAHFRRRSGRGMRARRSKRFATRSPKPLRRESCTGSSSHRCRAIWRRGLPVSVLS